MVSSYPKHLHHLIPEVVDYFYGDSAVGGFREGARDRAVEGGPRFFVDLGFQRGFQRAVGVVGAEEVGLADEEAFFVEGGRAGSAADADAGTGFADTGTDPEGVMLPLL